VLTLQGSALRLCDRLPRREFLSIGSLALGGLSLPQLLKAERLGNQRPSHKSVIMIYLTGGPPHQDMVDVKPDAPVEIRGEFKPIATSLPGVQLSELMPCTAAMMDKFAIIRSLVGAEDRHSSFQCVTGHTFRGQQPQGGWPEIGSVLSKLKGPVDASMPPAIDLSMKMAHDPYNLPGSGFLGMAHTPFKPSGDGMADMVLQGITRERLSDRGRLLAGLDQWRRKVDQSSSARNLDEFTEQALGILTSSRLVEALDLEREDQRTRERYGQDDPNVLPYSNGGYQAHMSKFLTARRLVEAGARCVTVAFADFDWHGGNFKNGRKVIPLLDQGLAALVSDLHERGMDRDVSVVVWGEFGRTPKINDKAGRDHWPRVTFAMLAGGGMRTGQVIGETNRYGEEPIARPVHYQDVFATLYHNLGIDPGTTIPDLTGRPQYINETREPIRELV